MRLILILVAASVSACGRLCPAIYYAPALTVSVSDETGARVNDFTLTVTPGFLAESVTVTCPQDPSCGPDGATVGVREGKLEFDVVAGARRATFGLTPTYEEHEATNGCPSGSTGSLDITVH